MSRGMCGGRVCGRGGWFGLGCGRGAVVAVGSLGRCCVVAVTGTSAIYWFAARASRPIWPLPGFGVRPSTPTQPRPVFRLGPFSPTQPQPGFRLGPFSLTQPQPGFGLGPFSPAQPQPGFLRGRSDRHTFNLLYDCGLVFRFRLGQVYEWGTSFILSPTRFSTIPLAFRLTCACLCQ